MVEFIGHWSFSISHLPFLEMAAAATCFCLPVVSQVSNTPWVLKNDK